MATLATTITHVRDRIEQASKRRLNEQNTKATLVEPVLRSLGWDVEDVEEVQREYRLKKRDKPVDYGLLVLRTPRLFLEAKALGENLSDRRWANQIMGYASVAGVEWMVLTDGNEYRIYNTHAPVSVDEKLFRTIRLTDDDPLVQKTLELLAKDRMEENRIEILWRAQFVDRQVRVAIEHLLSADNDMVLVNHVMNATKNLTAAEVRASLARCQVSLDFPVQIEPPAALPKEKPTHPPGSKASPTQYDATISDLIRAGLIAPPTPLERKYKRNTLTAEIRADGSIWFAGKPYESLSKAGSAARTTVIGLKPNGKMHATNGWSFWRVRDGSGALVPVDELRQAYISKGSSEAAG